MALPDLIEIVSLEKPVHAEITVPGSKSITNRALILAALADGEVTLQGALWSEDTQIMVECLQELGFMVNVAPDPNEFCNRTITVYGKGGIVPPGGTEQQPLELCVGNAGTAARFLSAFVCLGKGVYRLHGVPRMHDRPQAALFKALRELGYRVDSANDKLPATIFGGGSKTGASCTVSIEESSQFASALLLCAKTGNWEIKIRGENAEESPYVAMTSELMKVFPKQGGAFQIEPDASSGSYFWGAASLSPQLVEKSEAEALVAKISPIVAEPIIEDFIRQIKNTPSHSMPDPKSADQASRRIVELLRTRDPDLAILWENVNRRSSAVSVLNWPRTQWQIDEAFIKFRYPPEQISRKQQLGDSIMTAIVIAPFADHPVEFTDLGRLRVQECERVVALRTELTKCGAKVIEEGDTLTVYPSKLHGAEIETYNDHRMAMCFAILGLKVPGIKIKNPACVKKTFPNFFQKLAAQPPHGLGAKILDGKTGRTLTHEELFAD